MPTPSIVVFDLGKVLVDFDYSLAAKRIASRTKIPWATVKEHFDHSPLLYRYETGLMTCNDFYNEACRVTNFVGTYEEFCGYFSDIFWEIPEMIEIHATLRKRGIPTYIFSNTNDLAITHIRKNFPFFANFDGHILSYEVGAMKPDEKIYMALEKMSGKRGAEILYLDDRQENIDGGAARGWQVILQTDPKKSRAAMQELGLLN
jgi:putative hydrolase of the HAD superfamily